AGVTAEGGTQFLAPVIRVARPGMWVLCFAGQPFGGARGKTHRIDIGAEVENVMRRNSGLSRSSVDIAAVKIRRGHRRLNNGRQMHATEKAVTEATAVIKRALRASRTVAQRPSAPNTGLNAGSPQ